MEKWSRHPSKIRILAFEIKGVKPFYRILSRVPRRAPPRRPQISSPTPSALPRPPRRRRRQGTPREQVDGEKKIELKPDFLMEHDENVGAVVVGFDRYFNYYKVQYATLCVRENPGCLFIATNRDAVTHLTDAQEWAGGGSMVGAICGSTQREPLVVGKPSTFMMDYLSNKFGITKSQICMIGDRLDTDILFGQNGGCRTLLVLSGVTTLDMLQSPNNPIKPDFYTNKISDLLALKAAAV